MKKNFDECGCGTVIDIKDGKYYFDDGNFIWIKEQGLWKLVEQNHTDKIETKFKVGDWIITSENKVLQITSIEDTRYRFNNESRYWEIYYCDKECRLWTIEDAKPGDIIYAESKFATFDFIVIFSKLENKNVGVYCGVSSDSDDYSDGLDHWEFDNTKGFIEMDRYNFYPVSKEQRDLLFTKMKEAGYEWAKKPKELK